MAKIKAKDIVALLPNENDVLTVEDIQRILRVSRRVAYDLVRTGKLYAVKCGNIYRIPKTAVINYLTA